MFQQYLRPAIQKLIPGLLFFFPAFPAFSQIGVGASDALFIKSGITLSVDSLVLTPSADLTLISNSIVKTATPVNSTTPGINSLERVYNIGTPFTYSGVLGIFYRDAELGGNTENQLQLAFSQAPQGPWTTTSASSIDVATNYVSYTINSLALSGVSATTLNIVLPVTYSNFFAQLNGQFIIVNWEAESNTQLKGFTVESSIDGSTWKKTGYLPALAGENAYSFKDADLDFAVRYYRIAILEATGKTTYTKVTIVRKPASAFTLQVLSKGTDRTINFLNSMSDGIQLYDLTGKLLKKADARGSSYTMGNIARGFYILHFKVGTEQYARKLFLQ